MVVLNLPGSTPARRRLARIVRDRDCDVAEAALLCCVEVEPDLDVDGELLRVDALADRLRTSGFEPSGPRRDAKALGTYLGETLGFVGDHESYHDPQNALLTRVLDRRRGLPITLAILYMAVGSRVGIRAHGIATPGHFLVGVGPVPDAEEAVVIDPFHGGAVVTEHEIDQRIQQATGGMSRLHRGMLSPAPPVQVVRRLLNNLTRDFLAQGDTEDALWTVELKRLLPDTGVEDARVAGQLLVQLGRYRSAAETVEAFVAEVGDSVDADELSRLALRARAKMN
ncbi:MAG: transglutaminase-like domain-containing protein [Actinobacteria bacterium]|nr:transglutaminase-like domain-containing protein [Actinomycetota bacterium]